MPSDEIPPNKRPRRRAVFLATGALALLLAVALWRLLGSAGGAVVGPLPDDPAERVRLFKKDLRENPLPERPAGRKPFRAAYKAWLAEHGASFEETPKQEKKSAPPPVVDFGSMELAADEEPAEPERIEPNDMLDAEDLRYPGIYFEMARHTPELNNLEEQRDTMDFFLRYREQLKRDYQQGLSGGGATPKELLEIKRAMERYDEAIGRLEKLIAEQEHAGGEAPPSP